MVALPLYSISHDRDPTTQVDGRMMSEPLVLSSAFWKWRDWWCTVAVPEGPKGRIHGLGPLKESLGGSQGGEWGSDRTIVSDETSVEFGIFQETLQQFTVLRNWPGHHCAHLGGIYLQATPGHNIAKKGHRLRVNLPLFRAEQHVDRRSLVSIHGFSSNFGAEQFPL